MKTAKEVRDEFTNYEKYLTYELVGQALQNGHYNREALVMLDGEKRLLVELILREVME